MASKADSDPGDAGRSAEAAAADAEASADAVRERVLRALASAASDASPLDRLLAHAEGPVSPALRAQLEQPARAAAVLLGLVDRPAGWTVLLTERAGHLRNHAGQVSLPGGRLADPREAPVDAALREAWEEVGLARDDVEVAGSLGAFLTGTGFRVTPVVGFVARRFRASPDPGEVAAVFEVPLELILAADAFRVGYRDRYGTRFRTFELAFEGHRIWGATAAMLISFRDLISNVKT